MTTSIVDQLRRENEELRRRLEEAEDALRALRAGEVDAILVDAGRARVLTLDAAEKPYWLMVAQMPHPAATLTADGTIIACNRRFAELLKRPLDALAGKPIYDFVPVDGRLWLEALLRDGLAGEIQGEVSLRQADGGPVPVYLGIRVLEEGALGRCLMITDLSEQRHYQELQRAQAALRDADRRKDEFLATLAHELRNPLAPIRNAVQILKAKLPPNPELQWGREVIDRQVQLMARLLDDLLDVSRISHNKLELRKECTDLATVLDAALETSRPTIEGGGHKLTVTLPLAPIYLEADAVRLEQVFANLLNNAAKYTKQGGCIWLSATQQGNDVLVSVKDAGIGILPEMLPHIFDIFAQAQRALDRAQGGLGIGLALVKGLLELHGGSIVARSDGPDRGSEFVVRLPVTAKMVNAKPPPRRAGEGQVPTTKSRILVVDDNQDGADSLSMLLKILGHEVGTAYDGEQAVEVAAAMRPDVVLLDLGMPTVNGYEVCRRIREQPWGQNMFLIAMSGWGQEDDRRRTQAAGFDLHMVKPVDPAVLRKLLASLSLPTFAVRAPSI